MRWPWTVTIDLPRWGTALCWTFTLLCVVLPFWVVYSLLVLYRYLAAGLSSRMSVFLSGIDAVIGQELNSPNCMINAVLFLEGVGLVDANANFARFHSQVVIAEEPPGSGRKRFPNFSRCLSFRCGFLAWRDVGEVVAARHLYEYPNVVTSQEDLQRVINEHFNRVLTGDRPPWELIMVHLEERWRPPRYPSEVIPNAVWLWRVHHSIVDGVGLLRIMSEVLATNHGQLRNVLHGTANPIPIWAQPPVTRLDWMWLALGGLVRAVFHSVRSVVERDRGFLLSRRVTHRKNFVWSSRPLALARVRTIKNETFEGVPNSVSVNDVVLSCVTGALRSFLAGEFGGAVPERLQACMPVCRQVQDEPVMDGNYFVPLSVKLATGIADPRGRLISTKMATDLMKDSVQGGIPDLLTQMAGKGLSRCGMRLGLVLMSPSIGFSNLTGSPLPLELVGCRLADCCLFSPNWHIAGVTVAITSYCDSFNIAVVMDTGINKNVEVAQSLIRMVEDELELLEQILHLQEPVAESDSYQKIQLHQLQN